MRLSLVTGANGHLGNNLCRMLVERGERVRAMIRPGADPAPLADLDVEIVHGDIVDAAQTARAVAGTSHVYHVAAGFLLWARDPERDIIRPSVDGTRNVIEAAAHAGVRKVLYTSTIGTIGLPGSPGPPLDETHFNTTPHTPYVRGKIQAEREAFAISRRTGLPLTSIHPGVIFGPRFWRPSESVSQVLRCVNHGMPIYFEGSFGVVDVEDVAHGAILAMEKGRSGERYILSGENVPMRRLFELTAELTGLPPPRFKLPVSLIRMLAAGLEAVSCLTGKRPALDRSQVDEFVGVFGNVDSSKAERELGYTYLPARETLRRTLAWLISRGYVTPERRRLLRPHPSLAEALSC